MVLAVLRFFLLGPFEVFRDEKPIFQEAFKTRHARCVLKFLLTEHDRPVSFARLTDAFWPDSDPETARNSLHVAIRTLRRVLEPELARGAASRYIVTVAETYRFVSEGCATDVASFLDHRRAGQSAERRVDPGVAIDSYRAATALYRGEYVAEEAEAAWVLGTRERLREAFLDTSDRLAELLASVDRQSEAVEVIERALLSDPLREDLYLRLMRIHARAGKRAHVTAVFERYRRVARAHGTEPGPALARLHDDVVSGRMPAIAGRTISA